ncbi:MAG TPA: HEAT repeat domain-containing protein [archaeon]|nr:HEAT repeat domain-containing protein [archaeon]
MGRVHKSVTGTHYRRIHEESVSPKSGLRLVDSERFVQFAGEQSLRLRAQTLGPVQIIDRLKSSNSTVVDNAIFKAAEMRLTKAIPRVIGHLRHKSPAVRNAAAMAFQKMPDERAVMPLFTACCDNDHVVAQNAAKTLADIHTAHPEWFQDYNHITRLVPKAKVTSTQAYAFIFGSGNQIGLLQRLRAVQGKPPPKSSRLEQMRATWKALQLKPHP